MKMTFPDRTLLLCRRIFIYNIEFFKRQPIIKAGVACERDWIMSG